MPQSLIPIRVDAWSADKSCRVVDTFLLDPTVWPIPSHSEDPSVMVEENTQFLADSILLDAEVLGISRSEKQPSAFTGRLSLWSFSLQQRLCDQIRGQLWRALTSTSGPRRELQKQKVPCKSPSEVSFATSFDLDRKEQEGLLRKRELESDRGDGDVEDRPAKRFKTPSELTRVGNDNQSLSSGTTTTDPPDKPGNNHQHISPPDQAQSGVRACQSEVGPHVQVRPSTAESSQSAASAAETPSTSGSQSLTKPVSTSTTTRDPIYASKMPLGKLIPIRIRLTAFGVRIHDDFYIDPALDTSPLLVAQSIAKDLNIQDDLVIALALDIAEQIHGISTSQHPILPAYDVEQGAKSSTEQKQITAAYKLEQKVHIANVAHLVHDYRS